MDREHAVAAMMDESFAAVVRQRQEAVASPDQGRPRSIVWHLCRLLHDWLGQPIGQRDPADLGRVRLDPERICFRMTQIAENASVSHPHMLMSVVAMIECALRATKTTEAERAVHLWTQYVSEAQLLSQAWLALFKPNKRFTNLCRDYGNSHS